MKVLSYTKYDAISQYSSYGYVKEATIVQSSDGYQVEFYILDDISNAISIFNTNQKNFESYKSNSSVMSTLSSSNYPSYSLTSSGYYFYLCRVDNTLLYVRVSDTYKVK